MMKNVLKKNKNLTMHECVENDDEIARSQIRHELDAIIIG